MATLLKVKLVPLLEWTQVKGHGNKSDLVAIYNKSEKETENVYFERRGTEKFSTSKKLGTDGMFEHASSTCMSSFFGAEIAKQTDHNGENIGKVNFLERDIVTCNNKQFIENNSCQPDDYADDKKERDGFSGNRGDGIISHSSAENNHFDEQRGFGRFKENDSRNLIASRTGNAIQINENNYYCEPLSCHSAVSKKTGIDSADQEAISSRPGATTEIPLAASIKYLDGLSPVIFDKNDDRNFPINEHNRDIAISAGYLPEQNIDTAVTQTDNRRRSAEDLLGNNRNFDSCGESGGKSWFKGCSGCKHKHPAVRTISAPGEGRDAVRGGCSSSDYSQVDPHAYFPGLNDRSNCIAPGRIDGNVEFISTRKGVVKYSPSLTWKTQISFSYPDQLIETINTSNDSNLCMLHQELCKCISYVTDHTTQTSANKLMQQSDPNVYNNVVNIAPAVTTGAMLPNSNTRSDATVRGGVACSTYDSAITVNCNKLSDESVDDSAVGRTPSLEDGSPGKNKYKKSPDVKGAIIDNNPELKSSGCPCCLISPAGPPLENKSCIPGLCALHIGLEPTSQTDMVDNILKWEQYKAEAGQAGLTFSSASSNIRRSYNGNRDSCDEEAWIACERVVFSSDDQLPSGVEGKGMPHVGDTVDSQNSCYGIRQPRAAAIVPSSSNTNAKLSIEKTSSSESLLQLQVGTRKALFPKTLVPVQTHSEGSTDTSSPISSDAPNSASAGQIQSFAAVLRGNIKVEYHNGAGRKSSCPTSQRTNVSSRKATSHQSVNSPERKKKTGKSLLSRGVGDKMGNQNSSGVPGDRSRTPILGRRKNSTSGLFRAASSSMTRSVPVTPAGTPASIRSEKVGFFRKFRRNKNRSRSDSMASISSVSSTASTVSHGGYPGRGYEDDVSRDSQSSLATNSSTAGDGGSLSTMAGTAPPGLNTTTPPGSVNVPAPPHTFKQQATILQPISERPNETYSAHTNNLHSDLSPKNERNFAEKIPDHISDHGSVAQKSLSLIKRHEDATGSNLTLTDDGSEYLTASETDLSRTPAGKISDSLPGINCDNYKVTCGTHSQSAVSEQMKNKSEVEHGNDGGHATHFVVSSVDGVRSNGNIEPLREKSAGSLLPDQVSYQRQHISQSANTLTASTKPMKSDEKKTSSKSKQEKNRDTLNQSKTYAAVLGTGLFIANFSDTVSSDSSSIPAPDTTDPVCASPKSVTFSEADLHQRVNFPSKPAAPVCQVESPSLGQGIDNYNSNSLPRSFADVVNSPSSNKRVVQPPRGPFCSLTRKDSSSKVSDTVPETDRMPLAPGLHGKLPVAISKHGIRTSHKPVNEPIVHPQSVVLSTQSPPTRSGGNYKNVRPRTFATVAGQGCVKGQIGVKTVPGGNAGSPATTPDGAGGVTCHSLPRSTLSSAGSAPALGVCGARLRAAKAHSVQQLNATRSPPISPTKPPEGSPFVGIPSLLPQQAKSMPQLAGKIIPSKDYTAVAKVKSEEIVKVIHVEASSLPRLSHKTKTVTMPKPSTQVTKSKIAVAHADDRKRKDETSTYEKNSNKVSALVIKEPMDHMNRTEDESFEAKHNATKRVNVSDGQECLNDSSGSLHRLNTSVQQNTGAKSDKLAKSGKLPVTQIPHKERKTAAKNGPDGRDEMPCKVPIHTQKAYPPGQTISANVGETISTTSSEQGNLCSDSAKQSKSSDSKSTVNFTSKVPASSPNKQRSVPNDIKSSHSGSNQQQTKQSVANANIVPSETTKIDTNKLPAKHENVSAPTRVIQRPSPQVTVSRTATVACDAPRKAVISIESDSGYNKNTGGSSGVVREGSTLITPAEEELKSSEISTVDNSKQENKSGAALNDSQSSPKIRIVEATANTTQNEPIPEPRNDLIKEEGQQKESSASSEKSQPAQEVPFVAGHHGPISKTIKTSQHEKLTVEEKSGNLEQKYTSVSIEKVPTENLVFKAKMNDSQHVETNTADTSISSDQLKGTDVLNDESDNTKMGLGESKYVEDGVKKVAVRKLSQKQKAALQQSKYDSEGKIIGVSDKGRTNEKVGSISSDSTTVKGSQLSVKGKTECETNVSKLPGRGDDDVTAKHSGQQESSRKPQPPPRTQKPRGANKSQQSPGQKVVHKEKGKNEVLSTSPLQTDSSLGKEQTSTVKNKASSDVKNRQSTVELPTNNGVTRRDGSDKIAEASLKNIATKSSEKSKLADQNTKRGCDVDKQAAVGSVDISRTIPSFISENNTAAGIGSSQGASAKGLQVTKKINTNTSGSKLSKMDGGSTVHSKIESESVTKKLLPGEESVQCKLDIDIKVDPNSQISPVTQDTAVNSKQDKQADKQSEPVDKHAVNIVECKDMQVSGLDSNQKKELVVSNNDTSKTDRTSGCEPKIFDEMISLKDVDLSGESSSACTSLEMDEKIQNDMQSVDKCTASLEGAISQIESTVESVTQAKTEDKVGKGSKQHEHEDSTQKVKISIDQTQSASEEVPACDVTNTEPKIITEEEVTFTIDIPADYAKPGRPLPEVSEYVSATCIAVTSTSGTINTTSQLGGTGTTTSVSDDGQALMSVSSGSQMPLASTSAGGEALSSHQKKDDTSVNICIDRAPAAAEVIEGSAEVKQAGNGQEEEGSTNLAASEAVVGVRKTDMNVHTEQVEGIPEIVESNEAANDTGNNKGQSTSEIVGSQTTVMEDNTTGPDNLCSCSLNAINEEGAMGEARPVQHMATVLSKVDANVQFCSPEKQSSSLSGGKHSDKFSPNESEENSSGIVEQHAGATADPISILKGPLESEQAHSTEIASSEGGGCDPGNIARTVEEISVSGGTDTASINITPQIAITAETANKDSVVESAPAECNVNNSVSTNITDYLRVDDHLGLEGAESDSCSIGRLIHSSEGEHSDVNLDDIVVRNMEECNIKVKRFGSESSESNDTESDEESSSARESESEEDNNKINSQRKGPDTINDSDLSDNSCNKLKAKKIENVEETSSDDESSDSESEDEKPKKCLTDDENHIKSREEPGARSPDDCCAAKLENMGHKVGEAYFVTRRRKRAKMVDRETITQRTHEVQCPEVCHVSTDTFDSILISSSGSSDTSPSRVQWEDDSVDELDAGQYDYYSDEEDGEWYEGYSDDSVYSDDEDSQLGATAAGPVKVIYSRPRLDSPRDRKRDRLPY